jgi:hypothetical protein
LPCGAPLSTAGWPQPRPSAAWRAGSTSKGCGGRVRCSTGRSRFAAGRVASAGSMHGSPAYGPSMQAATVRGQGWASRAGTCRLRHRRCNLTRCDVTRGDPCKRRRRRHSRSRVRWVNGCQQHATNTVITTIRVSRGRGSTLTNSSSRNSANSVALDLCLPNTSQIA